MKKIGRIPLLAVLLSLFLLPPALMAQKKAPVISPQKFLPQLKKTAGYQRTVQRSANLARTASCSGTNFTFTRQSQIDSFPIVNPGCTVVQDLLIDGAGANPAITRLDSLKYITEITGQLNISRTKVPNLNGLTGLQRIGWILWMEEDSLISNIKPPNVTYINGVILNNMPAVTTLAGFLTGLTNTRLDYFWLFNDIPVTGFNGLQGIDSINHIGVAGLANFKNFNAIAGFHYCEDLFIWGNPQLDDVTAFSNITDLSFGDLSLSYNNSLTSWNGLQNITHIANNLKIEGTDFPSLAATGLNPNLVISRQYTTDSVSIANNYNMAVCGWPPLCNYLAAGNPARIENNAPGCENLTEVQAACGVPPTCPTVNTKIWTGFTNNDWNDANNWSPIGVPGTCDSVVVPTRPNRPELASNVTIHALTVDNGEIYMNGYNLTVNGDVNMSNAYLGSDGSGSEHFTANYSRLINISNSQLYMQYVNLQNYQDSLTLTGNTFDKDVVIYEGPSALYNSINGNNFGSLAFTSNTANNAEGYISTDNDDYVNGNFTLTLNTQSNLQIGINNTLHVGGDFVVNNSTGWQPSIGGIDFNGSGSDVHVTQGGSTPIDIGFLYTNKYGGNIVLDQNTFVSNNLTLGSGHIRTAAAKLLILKPNAWVNQTSSASWVWGPLKKLGLSDCSPFTMPVGDSIYRGECYIKNTSGTGCDIGRTTGTGISFPTDVTVQYFHRNPSLAGLDTAHHQNTFATVSGNEYWKCSRDSGSGVIQLNLRYDPAVSQLTNSVYGLREAHWNGSQWTNYGAKRIDSGGWAIVTPDSVAPNMGYYTLGYLTRYKKPVITLSNRDSVACGFTSFWIRWTVDTPMLAGNQFLAYLSDSSGAFTFNNGAGFFLGSKTSNRSDSMQVYINTNVNPPGNNYRIRLVGTQPADTSVNTRILRLRSTPQLPFTIVGRDTACSFSTVKYYVSQREAGASYTWSVYGGTLVANGDTATVTWGSAYNISYGILQATASNACGNGSYAYLTPRLAFTPSAAAPVITNAGRWLSVPAPPANQGFSIQWYKDGVLISGATSTRYYASQAGSYTVNYTGGCVPGPLSNAFVFPANAVAQSINFASIPAKTYGDPSFTLNATASSGLPVEFTIVSGPGNILGNVFYITGAGTVTVRASQPGNNTYDTAAYVLQTFVVNKASQSITFATIPDKDYTVGSFALSASATSGLPVTFTLLSGPATVSGNTLTITGVGTVTVRASQIGDNNYLAATAVDRSFCVRVANLNGINGPISICPGIAATYATLNVPGAVYSWRLQSSTTFSSTTSTLTTTWPSPGTYTLIVSATGPCGTPSKNDTLVVTAITSAAPDSVHNMLPVNGAVNQQLPLNLSWIPANPDLYYTYDVYVWKASDPQPSTPYASNLTTVNYTIPLNSGLQYNTTYKWMVVAHNGSCVQINTGPVQTFTLIPLPDLQVYNVTAPATAFSGQSVSVTWKVKNNGPGATALNQSWTDAVFISKDSVLNLNGVAGLAFPVIGKLMATKPNVSALNINESYNDTATFTLPIDYAGPLYFHVVTNYQPPANNPVIETTYANDTAHALPVANITLSPQPDFRVDTVLNPGNTFSGSLINVTYKVKNYGVTATGSWVDKLYISKDAVFNPATALRLYYPGSNGSYFPQTPYDVYRNNTSLQADSSYTVSVQAVVPNFIFGQYYVYVITNATASVYEGPNGGNNMARGPLMQVFLTATPLLTPTNVSVPSVIGTAQTVAVNWSTYNKGAYDNIQKNARYVPGNGNAEGYFTWGYSTWYDRAFLSTDSSNVNVNTDLKIADIYQYSDIYPGKAFPVSQNWVVPDNLPTGDYWIWVFANATRSVFEYPGLPQIVRTQKITVVRPDLSVPSVTVPGTGASGQSLSVNYTVQNNSAAPVNDRYRRDYFYLGNNPTFDGTAVLIDSAIYTSYTVPANGSAALQKQITLPNGVSGAKYIFVRVNGFFSFTESNFGNNTSAPGAPVNILLTPSPDLTVATINTGSPVYSNTGFPFAYTVNNVGAGVASGNWKDSVFVSCNSTFNPSTAYYVAERPQQLYVPAGSSYTDSFSLAMPQTFLLNNSGCMNNDAAQVYFFVKTNANSGVYETITNNNVLGTQQRTVINTIVDHIVTAVNHPDTFYVGRYNKTVWTVKNIGLNPNDHTYSNWTDGIYLSTDTVFSANDYVLYYKGESSRLAQNASYNDSVFFYLNTVPNGTYYVLVKTNTFGQIPAERNLNNNAATRRNAGLQALPVYVTTLPSPDLIDTVLSAPASVAVGQPVKIVYTVTNTGVGTASGNWYDNIWLSNSFAPGGYLLGQKTINRTLAPGQSYTDSITANVPINFTQGNYVIVVHASAGGLYESNANNNFAYRYISVYTPAPVDLVVNNIAVADTVTLGYPANVSWNLFNNSGNPANGTETDGVYLSTDSTTANTADVLIGTKINTLNLLPLNSVPVSLQPVVSGVAEGSYYLKVRTDILRNILETNTDNNTGLLNKKVYVKVKVLPLNVVTPDALTNTYLYYKLVIPTALKGKTVQVKLVSNDSLTATNQLYIGVGYLPSAAKFDYSHSAASGGNQSIIIESALDTVYYIAARNTKPGTQQITLQAVQLPFALLTVQSNKGGNTGNVTVKLSGTLFSSGMTAKLRGVVGNNTITANAFYFVNGTTAYATFNLRGAPLGLYDVSLTKPDNSSALLASSFTVENTSNGGLLTGGDNTGQTGSGNAPGCDPGAAGGLNTQLQTELVIPPKVFNNWPFVITINYTNASNVDIPAQVRVLYSHDGAPLALTEAGLSAGKTSLPIEIKDSFGPGNVIRAGSTGTIRIYSKAPASAGAHSIIHFNLQ